MKREHWGGRLAFVLAAAGSAVGLGNIWKFPYITGVHGGAAFILVYLVCIALVGLPIMIAELVVGRVTQKSPISAFKELAPRSMWWVVGAMGVMAGYVILSFYSVVAGWTGEYLLRSMQGNYTGLDAAGIEALREEYAKSEAQKRLDEAIANLKTKLAKDNPQVEVSKEQGWLELGGAERVHAEIMAKAENQNLRAYAIEKGFGKYIGSVTKPLFWHALFMVLTMFVVSAGVGGGIEKASKILMPMLCLIMVGIAIKGLTLPGAWAGVEFLIKPDFSKLSREAVIEALGHAFFTLSLGMGAMLTYGSYLDDDSNLYKNGMLVVIADTVIALVAGLAIYPMVFSFGLSPNAGPGLIFVTLPVLFSQMAGGYVVGSLFFLALFVAALTSAISLLEVCVAHFVDELGWGRIKATVLAGLVIFVMGVPSAWESGFKFMGYGWFDCMDKLSSNFLLPVGGLMTALFVGWGWSKEEALKALETGDEGMTQTFGAPWRFLCQFVSPALVLLVILHAIGWI